MSRKRQHGTGTVFQRSSDGRWVGRAEAGWTARGTRRRISVTADTEAAAHSKLSALRKKIAREGVPSAGQRTTVAAYAQQWLATIQREVRSTTWQTNASQVKTWIVPVLGRKRLDRLTPGDVRSVANAALDAGRADSTARRIQIVLQTMLKAAIIDGHDVPQRCLLIKAVAGGESYRDSIPLPDALAILRVATERPDSSRWVAALLQGMRPAECLGLTWDAIDLDAGTIDVSWQLKALQYRTKRDTGSGFHIPSGQAVKHLRGAYHLVRPKTSAGRRLVPLESPRV